MIAELSSTPHLRWKAFCDPVELILADHRPGGQPLLGTVGNLDTIAVGLIERVPPGYIVEIEAIRLGPPLIFADAAPQTLDIAADTLAGGGIRACSFSAAAAPHLEATFHLARRFAPAPRFDAAVPIPSPGAATAAEIYAALFHGPAFRVIDRAALLGAGLVAISAATLPRLRRRAPASPLAPRAIEFGLQSAGLLQLALDGSMGIPLGIERITRFAEADVGAGIALHSFATRTSDGRFTIAVGHSGATILRIAGYASTAMPFAHDDCAARALADRLIQGSS